MSDEKVQFEEESSLKSGRLQTPDPEASGMAGFLMRKGVVTTQSEADIVLIAFVVVIVIAGWILYKVISPSSTPHASVQQIDQAMAPYIHANNR